MSKIFFYELRRAIFSKAFAFLMLLICIYCAYLIKASLLYGYANTAPFSEWSFISYLFAVSPFLLTTLLFYVSKLYSPYEKNVGRITSSMPNSNAGYVLIKLTVTTIAYILVSLAAVVAALIFYGAVLDFYDFKIYLICIAVVLVPQLLFLQGLGMWLCRLQYSLAFVMIAIIFLFNFFHLIPPYYFDVFGSSILNIPNNSIPQNGVIDFIIPVNYSISRLIFSVVGIVLIVSACLKYSKLRTTSV